MAIPCIATKHNPCNLRVLVYRPCFVILRSKAFLIYALKALFVTMFTTGVHKELLMRIPSYLSRNRFGIFYFRIVFPDAVCDILARKETRKSLKTYNRLLAVSMSLEFQQINKCLFTKIVSKNMTWREVKKVLDRVADHLFAKYVEEVDQGGLDFEDQYSLSNILPEANAFIRPHNEGKGLWHTGNRSSNRMANRSDFEASFHKQPAVVEFVNQP